MLKVLLPSVSLLGVNLTTVFGERSECPLLANSCQYIVLVFIYHHMQVRQYIVCILCSRLPLPTGPFLKDRRKLSSAYLLLFFFVRKMTMCKLLTTFLKQFIVFILCSRLPSLGSMEKTTFGSCGSCHLLAESWQYVLVISYHYVVLFWDFISRFDWWRLMYVGRFLTLCFEMVNNMLYSCIFCTSPGVHEEDLLCRRCDVEVVDAFCTRYYCNRRYWYLVNVVMDYDYNLIFGNRETRFQLHLAVA